MGFRIGSFFGGVSKGITENMEEEAKLGKLQIDASIKGMYHNYAEYKKEADKQKNEMRQTVRELSGLQFSDGVLDDKQLIALASQPEKAKLIIDQIKKDPEVLGRVSKNFVKALDNVPADMKPEEYVDSLFKTQRVSTDAVNAAFGAAESEGLFGKLKAERNLANARKAAASYGVSLEDLLGGQRKATQTAANMADVNLAAFTKKPEFKDLKDKALMEAADADKSGDQSRIDLANENLVRIANIEERGKTANKTEQQIQSELITSIQKATDPKQKALLTTQLRQRQALAKTPGEGKSDADKISQANLIVAATKARDSIIAEKLPPGSFITVVNMDGSTSITLKDLAQEKRYNEGVAAAKSAIIKEYTDPSTGMPRSEMHKNAMMSVGVTFDNQGKAMRSAAALPVPAPAPATPAPAPAAPATTSPKLAAQPTTGVLVWDPNQQKFVTK